MVNFVHHNQRVTYAIHSGVSLVAFDTKRSLEW